MSNIDHISMDLMLDSLKHYASKNLPFDLLQEYDRKNECPEEIVRDMYNPAKLGINQLLVPKEFGGLGGSNGDIYRICEALGRVDLGIATVVFATFLGSEPIMVGGTPEQKEKWMGLITSKGLLVAYGATEADAGSDLVNMNTRAERVYENGKLTGYRINGSKQWISNGSIADIYTVLALAPDGPSWFIVEKGAPGFSANKHEDKHGIRLSNTAGLALDDVIVPADNLIGGIEGQGFLQAQSVFGYTRLMVGAISLGAGLEAVEGAVRYAQKRLQGGGPLTEKQGYMLKLIVPHIIKLETARASIEEIAGRLDTAGGDLQTEGAIAKYFTTEAANAASEDAIQALGGYGYTKDFQPEKIKRDVKITLIYEGTSEILQITIFRNRWQEHLKSRGNYYSELGNEMDRLHAQNPDTGADSMAFCFRGLAKILSVCQGERLTRMQHVMFELGHIIACSEAAASLISAAVKGPFKGVPYDPETYRAISRVSARKTAFEVISRGISLVTGASGNSSENIAGETGLLQVIDRQRGIMDDMDAISKKLCETFHS